MIFTFLSLLILMIGIISIFIYRVNKKEIFEVIAVSGCVLGGCLTLAVLIAIGGMTIMKPYHREKWEKKTAMIEERIAANDPIDGTLKQDIQSYNLDLAEAKFNAKEKWFGWFNEQACLDYEEINFPD